MVTQADIDNLNDAIAKGVRSVAVGGQTITFNTIASLIQARNDLQAQLAKQAPVRRSRRTYAYHAGRGFE